METLAPPVELLMEVRFGIEKGQSLKKTLQSYSQGSDQSPWRQTIRLWLNLLEMGRSPAEALKDLTLARRQVLELMELGLKGEPIFPQVCALEEELFETMKMEIEEYVATLPLKTLLPLLFCQFPAFLILLLGPFLTQFLSQT